MRTVSASRAECRFAAVDSHAFKATPAFLADKYLKFGILGSRTLRQGSPVVAARVAGRRGAELGSYARREAGPPRVARRTTRPRLLVAGPHRVRQAVFATPTREPRMTIMRSPRAHERDCQPRRNSPAPVRPCPKPRATFAASVAAMPRPRSHRESSGTCPLRRAESSITIDSRRSARLP